MRGGATGRTGHNQLTQYLNGKSSRRSDGKDVKRMCDTWGDPCRCPQRATDVARRRDVDKEVSRGRSRRESSEGPNLNL